MENILENKKIKISQIIESYGFKQSNNGFQSQNVNIEFKDNFLTIKDKENVFDQLTIDNFKREHLLDRIGWVILLMKFDTLKTIRKLRDIISRGQNRIIYQREEDYFTIIFYT